uniref:SH2 domain-containing protein n=1 Tax=Strongyloides papillosus TaxID=174720 RepID=A0A0N5CAJ3_STREA
MISPWIKCCDKFSIHNKMEIAHPSKLMKKNELMYYEEKNDLKSTSSTDGFGFQTLMSYKDTIYLGIVPIDEVLLKTGYGHFYLYHPYNKNIDSINELDISLKLFAVVKTTPNVGLHIPIVRKAGYATNSSSIKNYYALGSFDGSKKKFESIDMLIDYYKKIPPSQIVTENKKLLKKGKIVETSINTSKLSRKHSSVTDASLINGINNQSDTKCSESGVRRKNASKKVCNDINKSGKSTSSESTNTRMSSIKRCRSKEFLDARKVENTSQLRNKKLLEDELKSLSISAPTTFKSSEPSTTLVENFDIKKKEVNKEVERDDDFYNSYYLGEVTKKEAKKSVKKSFDFTFYHRLSKKKIKNRKKTMYLIYKPIKGKSIHLPIIRKRNPLYDGSKGSVKRFYVVKTPYDTKDQFSSFKEMVDYYYDRIEKVKQLYQLFIK